MTEQTTEQTPSIGISLNTELPGKKTLVLQSFIERDCTADGLNATLDKLRVASDRQAAFGMIEILKLQLEQEEKMLADHVARMAVVDENIRRDWVMGKRQGDVRLSPKQENDQRQAYAHKAESERRVAKVKRDLAEYEAMIAPPAQPGA